MTIFGIDVSYHNGDVNWQMVKDAGVIFAVLKASAGTESQSPDSGPWFRLEMPEALRAGIPLVGAYHYLRSSSVTRQVDFFLNQLRVTGGYQGRIVMLDWERHESGDIPSWATGLAWLKEWRHRTADYPVCIYLPDWFYTQIPGRGKLSELGAPIWASEYGKNPIGAYRAIYPGDSSTRWHSYGETVPAILQYGSAGRVNGVSGNCDVNAYRGTQSALTKLLTRKATTMVDLNPGQDLEISEYWRKVFASDPKIADGELELLTALIGGYFHPRHNRQLTIEKVIPTLESLVTKVEALSARLEELHQVQSALRSAAAAKVTPKKR